MIKKNKKRITIAVALLTLIGALAIYFASTKKPSTVYTTTKVLRGNIVQTVSETGTVKADNEINLSFANAGKINVINAKVGDKVTAGQVLAELDYAALNIRRQEAVAGLAVAQGNLAKLISGATAQDIKIAQANVSQAQKSYNSALSNLDKTKKTVNENINQAQKTLNDLQSGATTDVTPIEQAISTAQVNLDNTKKIYQRDIDNSVTNSLVVVADKLNVVNNSLDILNTTLNHEDGKDLIGVKNSAYLTATKLDYNISLEFLSQAKTTLAKANADNSNGNVQAAVDETWKTVNKTNSALKNCYSALENSIISSAFSQADLDGLKSGINREQGLVSAAVTVVQQTMQELDGVIVNYETKVSVAEDALSQAQANYNDAVTKARNSLTTAKISGDQQINSAQSSVDSAREAVSVVEAQLAKILAPANQYDINLLQSQVRQAEANLNAVAKQIDDNRIKSPIDAIVTGVDYKIGEQATPGKTAIAILGENNFKIEVLISEADISKIKINQAVDITLDSYGEGVKFNGVVSFVEPAETVIQEVIYYKIVILFTDKNISYTIKSGMTANVIITSENKEGVLIIPNRALLDRENGAKYVRILIDNQQVTEKDVTLGIKGDDGLVEVLSGVSEGENVITKITEN